MLLLSQAQRMKRLSVDTTILGTEGLIPEEGISLAIKSKNSLFVG